MLCAGRRPKFRRSSGGLFIPCEKRARIHSRFSSDPSLASVIMARLAAFLLVFKTCASVRSTMFSQECSADKEIPCESLSTSAGYTYPLPQNMRDLSSKHCEHGWYFPNGTFLVDSTMGGGKNKLEIVVDVTPENLTVITCENLQWQLHCVEFNCMITYTVIDWNTNHMHKQDGTGGFPNWGIAVIGIVAVIGTIFASVWYCYRKSGNRWILQNCV